MTQAEPKQLWDKRSVLFLNVLILLTLLGGVLFAAILSRLPSLRLNPIQIAFVTLLCTSAGFQGGTFVWIHFFLRRNNLDWAQAFGFRHAGFGKCIATATMGLPVALLGVIVLGHLSTWAFTQLHAAVGWSWLNAPSSAGSRHFPDFLPLSFLILKAFVEILLTPAAEELIFRGVIYRTLRERFAPVTAASITAVAFSAVHFYPAGAMSLIFLSVVLAWGYERTGNLLTPILLHALFNAVSFWVLLAEPSWARAIWRF